MALKPSSVIFKVVKNLTDKKLLRLIEKIKPNFILINIFKILLYPIISVKTKFNICSSFQKTIVKIFVA